MPKPLLSLLLFILVPFTFLVGCSSFDNKNGNTAYLEGKEKSGLFGVRSQGTKLKNPDFSIQVDPNLARSLTYSRIRTQAPFIAMTFDDGPHPVLSLIHI